MGFLFTWWHNGSMSQQPIGPPPPGGGGKTSAAAGKTRRSRVTGLSWNRVKRTLWLPSLLARGYDFIFEMSAVRLGLGGSALQDQAFVEIERRAAGASV